jgi:HNH endonuclease
VSVGASVPGIPERTRRLVMYRDLGCRVPWCTQTRWLDVHHVIHREHGGVTELPNLVALCRRCHRAHHRGELGIVGDADMPDGLTFTDRDGNHLGGAPNIATPDRPPPQPTNRYQHPLGERLHRRWLFLSDPPKDPPSTAA